MLWGKLGKYGGGQALAITEETRKRRVCVVANLKMLTANLETLEENLRIMSAKLEAPLGGG